MVKIRLQKRYKRRKSEGISGIRLQKRARKKAEVFFPDDIMIDILRRLPAENSIRCGLVCRRWRDLTSTRTFKELQMPSNMPMIFVAIQTIGGCVSKSFLLDKWYEPTRRCLAYHRFEVEPEGWCHNDYLGKFSNGGLVVFQRLRSPEVIILNPTSHKNVQIKLSKELRCSAIYGVFFNPTLEEYCTLWKLYYVGKAYYKMLNLGPEPCWRDISNPWSHRVDFGEMTPLLIGEHLYWRVRSEQHYPLSCVGEIMEFDIRSEQFDLMRCPDGLDVKCASVSEISLLDIDGVLSFVLTSQYDEGVNVSVWKLKDRAHQLWLPMNYEISRNRSTQGVVQCYWMLK